MGKGASWSSSASWTHGLSCGGMSSQLVSVGGGQRVNETRTERSCSQ